MEMCGTIKLRKTHQMAIGRALTVEFLSSIKDVSRKSSISDYSCDFTNVLPNDNDNKWIQQYLSLTIRKWKTSTENRSCWNRKNIIWCKAIHKHAMKASTMWTHTCQWPSQLPVPSPFFDPAQNQMTIHSFQSQFFQSSVTILLSQIYFIA